MANSRMRTPWRGPGAVLTRLLPVVTTSAMSRETTATGSGRAEQRAAGVEASDLDVVAPAVLPTVPSQDPLQVACRGALTREEQRTVGLVPVGPADRRRRG